MPARDVDLTDRLLTVDLDGLRPYLNPVEQPIGTIEVEHAAEVIGETVAEIRSRYERLVPQLRLELDWKPGPTLGVTDQISPASARERRDGLGLKTVRSSSPAGR